MKEKLKRILIFWAWGLDHVIKVSRMIVGEKRHYQAGYWKFWTWERQWDLGLSILKSSVQFMREKQLIRNVISLLMPYKYDLNFKKTLFYDVFLISLSEVYVHFWCWLSEHLYQDYSPWAIDQGTLSGEKLEKSCTEN